MADLTSDAYIKVKGESKTEIFFLDTSAAQVIYRGQPVMIDQSTDTQNVVGFVDSITVDPADVILGIAAETVRVALGDAETKEIQVYTNPTIVGFKSAVFDNADLGKIVYMSDSGVLSETAADNPQIGKLFKVDDGFAFVQLTTPQIPAGA